MPTPRVKRGSGPKSLLTKATYRKKALPHLLKDFEGECAYCLDPEDFRHPSQNHVEHFNCKLHGRKRHQYKNLMLGCAACNISKHDKPVVNPYDKRQRLLNCTEENEFPEHIVELADGEWAARTPAGEYHLVSIGLHERCHQAKRAERRRMAQRVYSLLTQAVQYESYNPAELHSQILGSVRDILGLLDKFPPLITDRGVVTVREWLIQQGIDSKLVAALPAQENSTSRSDPVPTQSVVM